jgi:hypothetical protein
MNAPQLQHDWTQANQRLLTAEFARLQALLGGEDDSRARDQVARARAALDQLGDAAAIDTLAHRFELSPFERALLLLCAGVEMDARLARLCAEAEGEPQRPWATFGLALGALAEPHWSALAPVRPLRRWRLIEVDETANLTAARLRIDERVLHYLAGIDHLDQRIQPLLQAVARPGLMAAAHADAVREILARLRRTDDRPPPIELTGDDRAGQEDIAAAVAGRLGLRLFALAAVDIPATLTDQEALAVLWGRETALFGAALLIRCDEGADVLRRFVGRLSGLVFIAAREPLRLEPPILRHRVDKPGGIDQRRFWRAALGASAQRVNGALEGVAAQFRLSARSIQTIGAELASELAASPDAEAALWRACRGLDGIQLAGLAQRIEPVADWAALILPEGPMATLRQIAAHVRHRLKVYEEWGFAGQGARGLGIAALFAGESGTGKTMAAEVLARELGLDLYRIDLSALVSKYIGETEKNLRRVFDAAEATGAVLLFDEADALFGKRSEVRDSHDRYANIEVSYLLQRMDAYRGLAVLTTNHKAALDPAFQRRLRFIVQFPFPDQPQREAIWRRVFPAATPLDGVDCAKLARLNVAGGTIRNIALNAAFLAAEAGEPVRMQHLQRAAQLDAAKRERPVTDAETRGWV